MARIPLAPLLYDFPAEALARGPSPGFTHHLTTVPSTSMSQTLGWSQGAKMSSPYPSGGAASPQTQSPNFHPGQHAHSAAEARAGSNTYSSAVKALETHPHGLPGEGGQGLAR